MCWSGAACEAGIHAMRGLLESEGTEAVILVDASNAFNSLNREAALRNVRILCPVLAPILVNTYRQPSRLFIDSEHIWSQEGTTQGDPLAMVMYAIGTLPLIHRLQGPVAQVWYADDASAGGCATGLRRWWDVLQSSGPLFGYYPNPRKTCLIVKSEHLRNAEAQFQGTGMQITTQGQRHLGAPLGSKSFVEKFVHAKVSVWVSEIKSLSEIASSQPQAAYAALTHGLMSRWTHLMRTVPGIDNLFQPLEDEIRHRFLPALTGREAPSDAERELIVLPARHGGLGIPIPTRIASWQFTRSVEITAPLVGLIVQQSPQYSAVAQARQKEAKTAVRSRNLSNTTKAADL